MRAPLSALDLQISQGQAVLGLLERSEVPPLPAFYRLFYDYVAGVKGLFSVRLHSILTHTSPERSTHETVYEEFIRPYQTDDPDWARPIEWATRYGHHEIVELLEQNSARGG